MSTRVEAVCTRTCYDSKEGILYERGKLYTIDVDAFALAPRGTTQNELRGGAPNGLIKHFRTTSELPPAVARQVEAVAHGEVPRARRVGTGRARK